MNIAHPDVLDVILGDLPEGSTAQVSLLLLNGNAASGYVHSIDPGVVTLAPSADEAEIKAYIYVSRGAIVTGQVLSY